jgi:hypothetical protein
LRHRSMSLAHFFAVKIGNVEEDDSNIWTSACWL